MPKRILGAFVGVDRFADPTIRELNGCRRDALALSTLFADTIPEIESILLVDQQATLAAVRAALDSTLSAAGPDDAVVLSFSCHGTRDHRLVLHDTQRSRYADTTLDMAELAKRFQQSRAKVIVCVLDCCFSGGAPARVLDDAPATREPSTPLEEIAGVGRVLISASGVNEPALESDRHGLLTRSIFEAFEAAAEPFSIATVMDSVSQRVRAEAARLGHVQTPVFFGYIEGGLLFPPLRRGKHFYAAFPEAKGQRVSNRIADLTAFGLPGALLDAWTRLFPAGLNQLQLAAVNDKRILDGQSLLVVAPTSSGKTFIGEMAAAKAISDQKKAVFLFPYKALVNEKYDQFVRTYQDGLGMRVVRCTGDYLDQTDAFIRGKYDLAVLTYEMFLNLALGFPSILNLLGLVVVDEVQFIADRTRGIAVELLLTNLLAAKERGISPQLIALSAVIGDLNRFDRWLSMDQLVTAVRPVPLIEGVLDRQGTYQYLDADGAEGKIQMLPPHAIVQRKAKPEKQDVIVPLTRSLLSGNSIERIIVFRNQRGSAQGCALYLANELKLPPAKEVVDTLPSHDLSTSSSALRTCLAGGTAFHTANLGREERSIVEDAFRRRDGEVFLLAATTTVAAGINTPASTVILAEQEFLGEENQPFTIAEYKNMAGRAGRVGYNERGRSIILADTPHDRAHLFGKYVRGIPEPIRSTFEPSHTDTWILRLLAQVKRVPRAHVAQLLAGTYGGFLAEAVDPGWHDKSVAHLSQLLTRMIHLGLVEEDGPFVRLTLLGRACGSSSLSFDSALRLVEAFRALGQGLTAGTLMVLVQALPELDRVHTPVRKGGSESQWPHELARTFGAPVARMLQRHLDSETAFSARCKRAMVLHMYISGTPMETIEKTASKPFAVIGSGHVRQFADTTRFHLRAAYRIASALLVGEALTDDAVEQLLRQLETGLPAEVIELLQIPITFTRGEYLALRAAGIRSVEDFWEITALDAKRILGKPQAEIVEKVRNRMR